MPAIDRAEVLADAPGRGRHPQDTSWLDVYLSDIPHVVYQVDEPEHTAGAQHATVANKGNEAMAYLQFIIDYYDRLPESIAFVHGHRSGLARIDKVVGAAASSKRLCCGCAGRAGTCWTWCRCCSGCAGGAPAMRRCATGTRLVRLPARLLALACSRARPGSMVLSSP